MQRLRTLISAHTSEKMKIRIKSLTILKKKKFKKKKKSKKKSKNKMNVKSKSAIVQKKRVIKPMTEQEFIAFLKRLTFYNVRYMHHTMIVGIDEMVVDDDIKTILNNIKRALRYQMYNTRKISANTIVHRSKYKFNQIRIFQLKQVLRSIDETCVLK
eukprot:383090_1